MSMSYEDVAGYNAVTQRAQAQAQATYNSQIAQGQSEDRALNAAKFAWQQEMDKAGLTGMYQGQYTMPSQMNFATTFGQWYGPGASPTTGTQTLTAQQQYYNQAYQNALAYGQYYAPGTTPTQGQQTLQAQNAAQAQQNWLAGTYGGYYPTGAAPEAGTQTLAQQGQNWQQNYQAQQLAMQQNQQNQATAQNYLNLLSQLRGPADWAKYQQVLGSTPQGLRDLTAAAMGQYIPGGGATTGQQPQAADLNTMYSQVAGTNMGGAGAAPGSQNNQMGQLPAPNQIAAQSWNNLAPSQKQMLLGAYESQGWNKDDVTSLMSQALPKYAQNAPGAGTWRLQGTM